MNDTIPPENQMPKHVSDIFLHEISRQAKYAQSAFSALTDALNRPMSADEIFRWIEIFLNHAAKVSLLLWPSDKSYKARGTQLRELLKVQDDHPLSSRDARNRIQHIDEGFDDWIKATGGNYYIDGNVAPADFISVAGKRPEIFRHFDPRTGIFTFKSESFDLREILVAVNDVAVRIKSPSDLAREQAQQFYDDLMSGLK